MIKIVIIDGQKMSRDEMKLFLSSQNDFEIIGVGEDGYDAIKLTVELLPDIVLMDVHLPLIDGARVASIIKCRSPATSVIIITDFARDDDFQRAICSGVAGYLVRDSDIDYVAVVIRAVYNGGCFLSPMITARIFRFISTSASHKTTSISEQGGMLFSHISEIEMVIVSYIGQGFSNKEIAEKLSLKQGTVRNYISSILQKTRLRNRTQIAIQAIAQGFTINNDPISKELFRWSGGIPNQIKKSERRIGRSL
ncbi:MAG: response regulator transcription factor [Spirochaetaceae bacterium]|jgi:DNA-binding NarL/FixJ family response regulator|nr:response regulator transcription factor [Spirochaetaceae bacterium]